MRISVPQMREPLDDLNLELNDIMRQIASLKEMGLSEELTKAGVQELITKKNKVKERMHNLIDTL